MSRITTGRGTAALCFIVLVAGQAQLTAQAKPTTPARAKTAPAKAAPAKVAPKAIKTAPPPSNAITLTGCLEAEGRRFVLTDLEGNEAPKGRSWKTGFVTKKSKDMEVIGGAGVNLGDHLGRKVTVVGVKNGDAHLTARSIKQLSASCS